MKKFDWIFNSEGEVEKGKECVYDNYWNYPKVVTLAGYRPYYEDGTSDPNNDEVNELCYIETYEDVRGDCQLRLNNLFEIEDADEDEVLHYGEMYEVRGKYYDCLGYEKYVLIDKNTEYLIVDKDEIQERHDIYSLDEEGYKALFNEIIRGSIYRSDYTNNVGCTCDDVCSFCEGYYEWLHEQYGDNVDEYDNLESWLTYAGF